jgi:Photosynthesis system II assembly factor YCF48
MTATRHGSFTPLFAAGALSCAAASTLLGACASNESAFPPEPDAGVAPLPAPDAALDDAEAGPCTDDCEYFPEACAPDVLCTNGPFDPTNPAVGMDWRTRINVIVGRSASDVWLAGAAGAVAHFDGTSWTPSEVGTVESQRALWLLDSGEVSFGSVSRIYTRGLDVDAGSPVSAGGWSLHGAPQMPPGLFGRELTAAWAMPGSESIWLATEWALGRLRRTPASTFEIVVGIPSTVCDVIPCRRMRSIHGASEKTLWAVGDVGSAVRITDADSDTPTATPLNTLTWTGLCGVWAASDTDVWAVGGTGTIRHYTGEGRRWEIVSDVPTTENLNAVWGTSASDVWAAGNAGVVLHYDGTRWSRVKIAGLGTRRPDLYSVWSPGPGHIWIGGQGVVLALGGKP